jgi:hypothetical protein
MEVPVEPKFSARQVGHVHVQVDEEIVRGQ